MGRRSSEASTPSVYASHSDGSEVLSTCRSCAVVNLKEPLQRSSSSQAAAIYLISRAQGCSFEAQPHLYHTVNSFVLRADGLKASAKPGTSAYILLKAREGAQSARTPCITCNYAITQVQGLQRSLWNKTRYACSKSNTNSKCALTLMLRI